MVMVMMTDGSGVGCSEIMAMYYANVVMSVRNIVRSVSDVLLKQYLMVISRHLLIVILVLMIREFVGRDVCAILTHVGFRS